MASMQDLERALRNADAAGDVEAAKTLAGAITQMRKMQPATPTSPRVQSGADAGILGALDTVTSGFLDEAASGIDWALDKLPGREGRTYDEILAANRGEMKGAQEQYPGSYLTGQVVGGIGQGATLAGAGLSMGANAVRGGASLGRAAFASGVDGALLGAAQGAGSGETAEGRFGNAVTGGTMGFGLGAAAPVAVAGGIAAAAPLVAPVMARLRPQQYANAAIADGMRRGGIMADDISRQLSEAAQDGQGMFNVADAMGDSGQRMMSTIARTPNDARQGVKDALTMRQNGQGERLSASLADGFDARDTAAQRSAAMTATRDREANVAYGAARRDAGPANVTPVLEAIDATLSPGATGLANPRDRIANDSIEGALTRVRAMLSDGRSNVSDFNALFRAKLDVDDMIARAEGQGAGNRAHYLAQVQRQIDSALAAASGPYAGARDAFATASRQIDAVAEGSAAASPRARAADTIERFQQMTPEEQSAFRSGYADPIIGRVEAASSAPLTNKARLLQTEKSAQEFPTFAADGQGELLGRRIGREQRMFETATAALGGSKTADNLADAAEMAKFDPSILTGFAERGLVGGTVSAVAKALSAGKGLPAPVLNRVASALMETEPQAARALLEGAQRKGASNDAARGRAVAIINALTSSGAGRVAAP